MNFEFIVRIDKENWLVELDRDGAYAATISMISDIENKNLTYSQTHKIVTFLSCQEGEENMTNKEQNINRILGAIQELRG